MTLSNATALIVPAERVERAIVILSSPPSRAPPADPVAYRMATASAHSNPRATIDLERARSGAR
jgi:hypothetical protein